MRRALLFIPMALLLSWGCFKKGTVATPSAPPAPAATPASAPPAVTPTLAPAPAPLESAPLPKTITAPSNLDLCEMNFQLGNYRQAAKACDASLRNNAKSAKVDQALFYLGLSHALASDSSRDLHQTELAFKRLISEFPKSPYRRQAEYILGLQVQIDKLRSDVKEQEERMKKLSDELQVLKQIDLERKPSQPPQ